MEKLASKETRTSGGNENKNEQLVNHIITMFENLEPPVSTECCIYKVPYYLRKMNEGAYTPQVISIGPIHHNKERFQAMEKHKVRYFNNFKQQYEINLEDLVSTIREMEDRIRRCYVETVQLESDDFVQMIILDASFILELFLNYRSRERTRDDPMRVEAWLLNMVWRELLLLENQLPFFVIEKLYHLALPYLSNSISLIQLTFDFFKSLNIHNKSPDVEIQHFTDLLRFFQLPPHLPYRVPAVSFPKYSVTQLHEAGIKFKVVPSKCLLDLKFKKGVLGIPLLEFQDDTETLVRNIIELEQCDDRRAAYITDFYLILDRLIKTTEDVDLLGDKEILINWLGDNNVVTSMISNLNRGIISRDLNSDFYRLGIDLNDYYEDPWHRWKAILRRQYSIMAILALVLTLIQTVLSILQVVL
uniref:Uncharacterized protein n=1 Tax=Fagus sylvatica TaxID=28930 RepID=A0A2N9FTE1_FAGSY